MPSTPSSLRLCVLLTALLLPLAARAQIAAGQNKFLGNIIPGAVPTGFGTYWNQVTPENAAKWGSVEATRNVMNWTQLDTAYNYAQANGLKFKAHTLVWGSQYPAWITGLTPAEQRAEIEEWMTLLAARYPNLWAIDVVNEPVKTPLPFKEACDHVFCWNMTFIFPNVTTSIIRWTMMISDFDLPTIRGNTSFSAHCPLWQQGRRRSCQRYNSL